MPYSTHSSRFNRCQTVTQRFSINDAALRLGAKARAALGVAIEFVRNLSGGAKATPSASVQVEIQKNLVPAAIAGPSGGAAIEKQLTVTEGVTARSSGGALVQRTAQLSEASVAKPSASLGLQAQNYLVDHTGDTISDESGDPILVIT